MVFRGNYDESAGQALSGCILLHTSRPVQLESFRIRLLSSLEVAGTATPKWPKILTINNRKTVRSESTIIDHTWDSSAMSERQDMLLRPGHHMYPFELPLAGHMAESIEGVPELTLRYRLEVTVHLHELPMLHVVKSLRVIRAMAIDAVEPFHAEIAQGSWGEKAEYSVGISNKAVGFGGIIHLNICVAAHSEGVELQTIIVKVIENRESCVYDYTKQPIRNSFTRVIAERRISRDNCMMLASSVTTYPAMVSWTLSMPISLPQSLRECAYDVDFNVIEISHVVDTIIVLKNPDGHNSEVSRERRK